MTVKFLSSMVTRADVTQALQDVIKYTCETNLVTALQHFDSAVAEVDVTITIDDWLDNYDILLEACEDYMYSHYANEEMTYDDWERLMDYECSRHPEWADVE